MPTFAALPPTVHVLKTLSRKFMQIHISNLDANLIEKDLFKIFSNYGEVGIISLVRDKLNYRSTGRAFVEMPVQGEGLQAISALNGAMIKGKKAAVAEVVYDPAPNASWSTTQQY